LADPVADLVGAVVDLAVDSLVAAVVGAAGLVVVFPAVAAVAGLVLAARRAEDRRVAQTSTVCWRSVPQVAGACVHLPAAGVPAEGLGQAAVFQRPAGADSFREEVHPLAAAAGVRADPVQGKAGVHRLATGADLAAGDLPSVAVVVADPARAAGDLPSVVEMAADRPSAGVAGAELAERLGAGCAVWATSSTFPV
jgi:hypothetical protein